MYARVLPGTLAPRYQELHDSCTWIGPTWLVTWSAHSSCASADASATRCPDARISPSRVVIHSTWCSIDVTMFVSTDGEPGPVTVNRFGKPATATPRYALGAAAHSSPRRRPSRPRRSIRDRAPVIASKPVA